MTLRIIARSSPLAQLQSMEMAKMLDQPHQHVSTMALPDTQLHLSLPQMGEYASFCRDLDQAVIDGTVDLACHSLKDTPIDYTHKNLKIIAISKREDPRDALVTKHPDPHKIIRPQIGTSSPRRHLLIEKTFPNANCIPMRGNIGTRVNKLGTQYDCAVLAAAALHRLDHKELIRQYMPTETFTPPAGQGFIALVARADNPVRIINQCPMSWDIAMLERKIARQIGIKCHEPAGIYVEWRDTFVCRWFVGDLVNRNLFYGSYNLTGVNHWHHCANYIKKWMRNHDIAAILKSNNNVVKSMAIEPADIKSQVTECEETA